MIKSIYERLIPSPTALLVLCLCWYVRIDELFSGAVVISALGVDSDQFLSFAGDLINNPVPLIGGVTGFVSGFDIRTPVYPALLTVALIFVQLGVQLNVAVVLVHSLILGITLFGLYSFFRGWFSRTTITAGFLLSALPMRHYFFMVLAEWTAFCLLTLCIAATVKMYARRSREGIPISLLLASATALTRPDYLILFPIVVLCIFMRFPRSMNLVKSLALGALPIIVVLLVNYHRFHRLTLAPAEGHAFALLSTFSEPQTIEEGLVRCDMPTVTLPPLKRVTNPLALDMIMFRPEAQLEAGTYNLSRISEAFYTAGYNDWNKMNSCLLSISKTLIFNHPSAYLANYLASLMTLLWITPIVGFALIWKPRLQSSATPLMILFAVATASHVLHIAFVSAVNILHLRYYIVSFSPLIMVLYLAMRTVRRKSSLANLTEGGLPFP